MKKIIMLILLAVAFVNFKAAAQQGITVQSGSIGQESILSDVDQDLLSQYIAAARVNYPHVKFLQSREQSAKTSISVTGMSYFDLLNVSYIYRPNSEPALTAPG